MKTELILGRDRSCDIVLADGSVSRKHATLRFADGKIFVCDCDSTQGTKIFRGNEEREIKQDFVSPGLKIGFGDVIFTYEELHNAMNSVENAKNLQGGRQSIRMVRCVCGTPKMQGSQCPHCNS